VHDLSQAAQVTLPEVALTTEKDPPLQVVQLTADAQEVHIGEQA
jgi:hypothetical protein